MIGSSQGTHLIWEILTKSNLGSRDQKHLTLVTSLSSSHIQNAGFFSDKTFLSILQWVTHTLLAVLTFYTPNFPPQFDNKINI